MAKFSTWGKEKCGGLYQEAAAKAKRETETINDMIFSSPLDTCLISCRTPATVARMPKPLRGERETGENDVLWPSLSKKKKGSQWTERPFTRGLFGMRVGSGR